MRGSPPASLRIKLVRFAETCWQKRQAHGNLINLIWPDVIYDSAKCAHLFPVDFALHVGQFIHAIELNPEAARFNLYSCINLFAVVAAFALYVQPVDVWH